MSSSWQWRGLWTRSAEKEVTTFVWADMRMDDPRPTFSYLVEQLKQRFPNLAYLHVVSPNAVQNEGPKDPSVSLHSAAARTHHRSVSEVLYSP